MEDVEKARLTILKVKDQAMLDSVREQRELLGNFAAERAAQAAEQTALLKAQVNTLTKALQTAEQERDALRAQLAPQPELDLRVNDDPSD